MSASHPPPRHNRRNRRYGSSVAIVVAIALLVLVFRLLPGNPDENGASTTPAQQAGTASSAGLTCAAIEADPRVANRIHFKDGGTIPADVPVPAPAPTLTCSGTADKTTVTAAAWPDVSRAGYVRQLIQQGWTQDTQGAVLRLEKTGASHAILVYTQSGELVALYGPPAQG